MKLVSLAIFFKLLSTVVCLLNVEVTIPKSVLSGSNVTFSCHYDSDFPLYSVKWYFKRREFYRFTPGEKNPAINFRVKGIIVDKLKSNVSTVTIMDVSPIATGFYHLEIVVDSPWMETNMSSAFMQVITLPTVEPIMIVENTLLTSNDSLKATCTVENSFPPANISWSLDNKTINKVPFPRYEHLSDDGVSTLSELNVLPESPLLRGIFLSPGPFSIEAMLSCEVIVYHPRIYHKKLQQQVTFIATMPTNMTSFSTNNSISDAEGAVEDRL